VGLAIVSRIPAEVRGRLAVGTVPGDPTPERGGLHVLLDVEGTKVDLVGVHLTSRLPYGPPTQLRRLRPQLPDDGRPAIVAGDCNFWGPGVSMFLPGWTRTVRGRSWPASRPHSQIDHILVRDGQGVAVLDHEVLPAVGSDHRPVRARLRFR
jgi:endonuclease/exonuclease/phosphatase (EEP) superfamily protein YafD